MVGVTMEAAGVLDERQLGIIVEKALGRDWEPRKLKLKRAADGLTGFLGDHFRAAVSAVHCSGQETSLHLFIKHLPMNNQVKAEFIDAGDYNRREALMYNLFEELGGDDGPTAWRPKAFYCDASVLVMPDLSLEGFAPKHFLSKLELPEVLLTAASAARLHAAFADYTTRKTAELNRTYNFLEENEKVMKEPTFCESPFLHTAAKLSANLLNKFSNKFRGTIQDLEPKLDKLYLEACDSLREYPETLNVVLHKDLWVNNIMFAQGRAVLVDFQCVRYGPPAFDLLMMLYLCTTREFREAYERDIFLHYYSVFMDSVSLETKQRLKETGYDLSEFLLWCERGRMFGIFFAIAIFPYVLMEPKAAQRHYDDPDTYLKYCNEDRTKPVFEHVQESPKFLEYQLQVTEEFVERFLCKKI